MCQKELPCWPQLAVVISWPLFSAMTFISKYFALCDLGGISLWNVTGGPGAWEVTFNASGDPISNSRGPRPRQSPPEPSGGVAMFGETEILAVSDLDSGTAFPVL